MRFAMGICIVLLAPSFDSQGQYFSWPYSTTDSYTESERKNNSPGDSVYFDLSHAYQVAPTVDMQIRFRSDSAIHALDFALRYNHLKVSFDSLFVPLPAIQY